MSDNEYHHLLNKARDAKRGGCEAWRVMSTGEKVGMALARSGDWTYGL